MQNSALISPYLEKQVKFFIGESLVIFVEEKKASQASFIPRNG